MTFKIKTLHQTNNIKKTLYVKNVDLMKNMLNNTDLKRISNGTFNQTNAPHQKAYSNLLNMTAHNAFFMHSFKTNLVLHKN